MPAHVEIIHANGAREVLEAPRGASLILFVEKAIQAEVLDTVNLRDGRVMLVDDLGHQKGAALNPAATKLYHGVCRPGTTHQIRGAVAVALDRDFS